LVYEPSRPAERCLEGRELLDVVAEEASIGGSSGFGLRYELVRESVAGHVGSLRRGCVSVAPVVTLLTAQG